MSSHFLAGYHFCLVRDNRDQDQVNYEIAAIKRAGGQVSFDLEHATHVVVKLPSGSVWQCEYTHRGPSETKTKNMKLPQIMYAVMQTPCPHPAVVTPLFLDTWLYGCTKPQGRGLGAWHVTLRGPKPDKPKNTTSVMAQPMAESSVNVSTPSQSHAAPSLNRGPLPINTLPPLFSDIGSCTFYIAPGCAKLLPWFIKQLGGEMETARRALYVLVPDIHSDAALNLGPLHPSGAVLDEMFVFDCLRYGSFQNLDKYKVQIPPPPGSRADALAQDSIAPTYDGINILPVVPVAGPSNYHDQGPANQVHRSSHSSHSSPDNGPHNSATSEHGKRVREDEEADSEIYEIRRRVRVSMDQRWKYNIVRAVKKE